MHALRSRGATGLGAGPQTGSGALAASARDHPHIPRRRKSARPLRAPGGNTSPSAAMRSVSYWEATTDGAGMRCGAVSVSLGSFFFQDSALDCPRMDVETKFVLD